MICSFLLVTQISLANSHLKHDLLWSCNSCFLNRGTSRFGLDNSLLLAEVGLEIDCLVSYWIFRNIPSLSPLDTSDNFPIHFTPSHLWQAKIVKCPLWGDITLSWESLTNLSYMTTCLGKMFFWWTIRLPVYVSKHESSLTWLKESSWGESGGTLLYASFHLTENMIGGAVGFFTAPQDFCYYLLYQQGWSTCMWVYLCPLVVLVYQTVISTLIIWRKNF